MNVQIDGNRLVMRGRGREETRIREDGQVRMRVDETEVDVQVRPFRVGDEDPVGGECVLALFILCCLDAGQAPIGILRQALGDVCDGARITQGWKQDIGRIAAFEGVVIPEAWTPEAVDALLYSLYEAGFEAVVAYVDREIGRVLESGERSRLFVARADAYRRLLTAGQSRG